MPVMDAYRFRAPGRDGEAVAQPSLDQAGPLLSSNRRSLGSWEHDFQGRSSTRLRREAREQLARRSAEYHRRLGLKAGPRWDPDAPLVVTGHQPELFHPGVWAKNFAAAWIARQVRGHAINLVVDNDIPHGSQIRVPTLRDGKLTTTLVDFDFRAEDAPYEDWTVHDAGQFASFADRMRVVLHPAITDPLVETFWPLALRGADRTDRIGCRFVAARHGLEVAWGVENAELPLSDASETEAFLWFVSHILAQLPRFQSIHNACLERYRRQYKIRSRHHPVADLHIDGPWREAPFWVWRRHAGPRRHALLARQNARTIDLRLDGEDELLVSLPLAPDAEACCAVERLRTLPAAGVRLRPRALTTTMFARLLIGDLFLHGIGGAKYDELGDQVIAEFFGVEPPSFVTFSMTLWPGVPMDPASPERRCELQSLQRALEYNPDRFLAPPWTERTAEALSQKRRSIAGTTHTRRERIERFHAIRSANVVLREPLQPRIESLRVERARVESGLERNRVAQSRDFALVAHSRTHLLDRYRSAFPGLFGD